MSQTQLIMIDDTDSGINYSGNWIADKGSKDNLGNYGAPYMSTNHHIEGTGSFTYTFSGTYVGVFGTTLDGNDPARICQVDGVTIPNNNINTAANWFMHCQVNGLADTRHTLVVTVPTANPNGYWFDFLFYIPSASVSRDNAVMSIETSDPVFKYDSGWITNGPGHITNANGASMTMQFTGRSLTWLGYYFSQLPYAPTTATWSVDNSSPVTFNLNGIKSQTTGAEFNQRFFTTGLLPAGQHTLRVVYNGNGDTTPLSMYNVIVQNGNSAGPSIGGISGGGSSSGGSSGGSGDGSGGSSIAPTVSSVASGNAPTSAATTSLPSTPEPQPSTVVVIGTGASAVTVTVKANSTATDTAKGLTGTVGSSGTGTGRSSPISSGSAGSNSSGGTSSADSSSSGANSNGNGSSTNDAAEGPTSGSKSKIGPIVGAVVGVLAVLLLLFIVFFRRRRNRKRWTGQANGKTASKTAIVEPFISTRSSTPPPVMSEIFTNDHSGSVTSGSNHTPNANGLSQFYSDVKQQPADVEVESTTSTATPLNPTTAPNKPWRWQTRPTEPLQTPSTPSQAGSSVASPSSNDGPESEIIMMHEDSGVRLPLAEASRAGVAILEMPPSYSAT